MKDFGNRLKKALGSRSASWGAVTCLVVASVVLFNIVLYTLTSAFGLYAYSRHEDDLSISGNTDRVYSTLPTSRGVTVTFCMDEKTLESHTTGSFVLETARQFAERYSFISLRFVNLLTQVDQDGKRVDLDKYTTDMRGEKVKVLSTSVIFESESALGDLNHRVVTDAATSQGFGSFYMFNSSTAVAYCGEEIFGAMVAWVLNDEHKTAYLTQNHGETVDVSLSNLRACCGYYIDVINLRKNEVPADAGVVIISSPVYDFEKGAEGSSVRAEIERLATYMDKGGSLYVAIDPIAPSLPVLEEFIKGYGIEITGGQTEGSFVRHQVKDITDSVSVSGMSFVATYAEGGMADRLSEIARRYGSGRVYLQNVGKLKLSGSAGALLVSSPSSVALLGRNEDDTAGSFAVAAYSEKTSESGNVGRIFVVPGAFLSSTTTMITEGYSNKDFLYSIFEEALGAPFSMMGVRVNLMYEDTSLHGFTMKQAWIFSALIAALPVCAVVTAAVVVRRRKNR